MKVSKNPRQGRIQSGKEKPSEPKEICPKCANEYLEVWYVRKRGQFMRKGLYCPNDECGYQVRDKGELKMVKVEIDFRPMLRIFVDRGYAEILLEEIQISKFLFDEYDMNSRNEDWTECKNEYKPCIDFWRNGEVINIVRDMKVDIVKDGSNPLLKRRV